jgi:hypothetical protein
MRKAKRFLSAAITPRILMIKKAEQKNADFQEITLQFAFMSLYYIYKGLVIFSILKTFLSTSKSLSPIKAISYRRGEHEIF